MNNCQHEFSESVHAGYDVCLQCGTFHSRQAGNPFSLYASNYWSHESQHSTISEQVFNVTHRFEAAIGKTDKVMQYVPARGIAALEIACAPGELLRRLAGRFTKAIGVEVDRSYESAIRQVCGAGPELLWGFFPQATQPLESSTVDCLIGLDVFEHVADGAGFITECERLLKPGGTLILMSPFRFNDGVFDNKMFHPAEHVWIYSECWLQAAFSKQFTNLRFDRWLPGHELLVASKPASTTAPAGADPNSLNR